MKCKNDASRSYSGTEPSPKGKGFCAHAEAVGKKRKGRDGRMWIVKQFGKTKRWTHAVAKAQMSKKKTNPTKASRIKADRSKVPDDHPLKGARLGAYNLELEFVRNGDKEPPAPLKFLRSRDRLRFFDQCLWAGVIPDTNKAYWSTFDFANATRVRAVRKGNAYVLKMRVQNVPYVGTNYDELVPFTTDKQSTRKFLEALKDTINNSIFAGGFYTRVHPGAGAEMYIQEARVV